MRYVDFAIQTLLILAALAVLIASAFYNDILSLIAIDQFFLGVWQIAGCVTYLAVDPDNNGYRRKHLRISFIYILSLLGFGQFLNGFSDLAMVLYFIVPSWSLGIYYYFITVRTTFPRTGRGKFLPHLSF